MSRNEHITTSGHGWRGRAACRPGSGVDPELFFPTAGSGSGYEAQVIQAKAVCARCPLRAACLGEALARIPYGIAGGLTEAERRVLRRASGNRPVARAGTAGAQAESELEAQVRDGPQPGLTARAAARERSRVGRNLLATGRTAAQVARACQVTTRTVQRWATATSATATSATATSATATSATATSATTAGTSTNEGSSRANQVQHRLSTARLIWISTTAPEGGRA